MMARRTASVSARSGNTAAALQARLKARNIVVDVRDTRLRVGFGLYHNADDVKRLLRRLREL